MAGAYDGLVQDAGELAGAAGNLAIDGAATLIPGLPAGLGRIGSKADDLLDAAKIGKKTKKLPKKPGPRKPNGPNGPNGGGSTTPDEGIYQFTGASGDEYVGQSGNIPERLRQHRRDGKLPEGNGVNTEEVLGGRLAREIAEQRRIDNLGGLKNLENKINPLGPKRRKKLLCE